MCFAPTFARMLTLSSVLGLAPVPAAAAASSSVAAFGCDTARGGEQTTMSTASLSDPQDTSLNGENYNRSMLPLLLILQTILSSMIRITLPLVQRRMQEILKMAALVASKLLFREQSWLCQ